MPAPIEITNADINYAEKILLPEDKHFDDERITFIKNLETIDLQAVPGSGKTTVLLAKLLILERHLPFDDGSGILVLSHTNVAIDKIKGKIEKHCPKLFSYPNFVGTIQSFVDKFLAIPCYTQWFQKRPYRIDNEIYDELAEKRFRTIPEKSGTMSWLKNHNQQNPLKCFKNLRFDTRLNILGEINGTILLKSENDSATYKELKRIKWEILEQGFLHFDDAYLLGESLLNEFPKTKNLLQKRFCFVFIDEMQDMDKHQHDLIEKIFFDAGKSISIYQRIGDRNQAIFNGSAKLDDIWSQREIVLPLRGSHRLTQPIAELVNCFALETGKNFSIIGLREGNIKPHIIVYRNESIKSVIPAYANVINKYVQSGQIKIDKNTNFKAVAWRKQFPGENKVWLKNYHDNFQPAKHKSKIDYPCLRDYLSAHDVSKRDFKAVRNNVMNALLKVLRFENVVTEEGSYKNFTMQSLYKYLRENSNDNYEKLILYVYQWSLALIKGDEEVVLQQIQKKIPGFLKIFEKTAKNSKDFICGIPEIIPNQVKSQECAKKREGVDLIIDMIDVTTIHAEKGQDHTSTLYLETFWLICRLCAK